jgi:hypothetical protein
MIGKVEAANFVFVQLTGQEPGAYNKCHPDYSYVGGTK